MTRLLGSRLRTRKLRQALPRLVGEGPIAVLLTTTPAVATQVVGIPVVARRQVPLADLPLILEAQVIGTTIIIQSIRMTLTVGDITRFNLMRTVAGRTPASCFSESL